MNRGGYSEIIGDLFALPLTDHNDRPIAFGHGNNLNGGMIGGIAALLANRYPGLREAYDEALDNGLQLGGVDVWESLPDGRLIFNLATQVDPGPDARLAAIEVAVFNALRLADDYGVGTLAIPRIGAGIGGLSWGSVAETLERAAFDARVDCRLQVVTQPPRTVLPAPRPAAARFSHPGVSLW